MAGKKLNTYAVEAYLERHFKDVSHPENRDIEHTYLNLKINDDTFVDFYETGKIRCQGSKASEVEQKLEAFKEKWNAPKVFVVCAYKEIEGQQLNDYLKTVLEELGIEPRILSNIPSGGARDLFGHLKEHMADADHILVVMTKDEKATVQAKDGEKIVERPRPNVLLELGMALAYVDGTDKKVSIVSEGQMEDISDINGLIFNNFTTDGKFRETLYEEFKVAGLYNI